MLSKNEIERIYNKIAESVDISEQYFDQATLEYQNMAKWLVKNTPQYEIEIYPQGSFALGTVVQPFDREDEYDLDLVCEYKKDYGFSAKELKTRKVQSIIDQYGRIKTKKEKKRCWQVTYEHNSHFHMDVIPAVRMDRYIRITDRLDESRYEYIGSNPKAYIEWFKQKQLAQYTAIRQNILFEKRKKGVIIDSLVEPVKEYEIKTPLQKAIQILKRHRDVMFADDENNTKPISIIITTIAAELYQNETTVFDTLNRFLLNAKEFIENQKKNGKYYISNPTYTGSTKENFADKWDEHPERATAFMNWIDDAKKDLIDIFSCADTYSKVAVLLEKSMGEKVAKHVFADLPQALEDSKKLQIEPEIVPYKVGQIMKVPYKQSPTFKCPKGYAVILSAKVKTSTGYEYVDHNDGEPIPKNSDIDFKVGFCGVKRPFKVKWQIVNTGDEALRAGQGRGDFCDEKENSMTHHETTLYKGSHSIQCFVMKFGRCVAKSKIFIVNVQ